MPSAFISAVIVRPVACSVRADSDARQRGDRHPVDGDRRADADAARVRGGALGCGRGIRVVAGDEGCRARRRERRPSPSMAVTVDSTMLKAIAAATETFVPSSSLASGVVVPPPAPPELREATLPSFLSDFWLTSSPVRVLARRRSAALVLGLGTRGAGLGRGARGRDALGRQADGAARRDVAVDRGVGQVVGARQRERDRRGECCTGAGLGRRPRPWSSPSRSGRPCAVRPPASVRPSRGPRGSTPGCARCGSRRSRRR